MNSSFIKEVLWLDSKEFAGRIAVDQATGNVAFVNGPPELEEAVRLSLADGPHRLVTIDMGDGSVGCAGRKVDARDPMFEVSLSGVLGMSGFTLPPT